MIEYTSIARGKNMYMFTRLAEIWREQPDAVITVRDSKGEMPSRDVPVKDLLLEYVRTRGGAK